MPGMADAELMRGAVPQVPGDYFVGMQLLTRASSQSGELRPLVGMLGEAEGFCWEDGS